MIVVIMIAGRKYFKNSDGPVYTPLVSEIVDAVFPVLFGSQNWHLRHDIAEYLDKCKSAGFCATNDEVLLCVDRFLAGKREVTPPGTRRRKQQDATQRKFLANIPVELVQAIDKVMQTPLAEQFRGGTAKALNALVGMTLKVFKADPATVRQLIEARFYD